jgi:hypothetical protein
MEDRQGKGEREKEEKERGGEVGARIRLTCLIEKRKKDTVNLL